MVIEEGQFFKKVLGVRLSYLSRHAGIRRSVLERLDSGEDLFEIVRSIDVDGVQLDLVGDEQDAFAAELNELTPGAGDEYENEVSDDTLFNRQHRWDHWRTKVGENPALRVQVEQAVRQVLSYSKAVDVGGEYTGEKSAAISSDSGHPRLTFRAPRAELPGETKMQD